MPLQMAATASEMGEAAISKALIPIWRRAPPSRERSPPSGWASSPSRWQPSPSRWQAPLPEGDRRHLAGRLPRTAGESANWSPRGPETIPDLCIAIPAAQDAFQVIPSAIRTAPSRLRTSEPGSRTSARTSRATAAGRKAPARCTPARRRSAPGERPRPGEFATPFSRASVRARRRSSLS